VGSAINLSSRFRIYYSLISIENILTRSKSRIFRAILKYGYSKFRLEILEYCDSLSQSDLIIREQYYIDLLKPKYNILKKAGSSLGYKHTDDTRAKISSSMSGENHPMFGKPKPEGSGRPFQKIEVIDLKTNEKKYMILCLVLL